MTASAAAGVRPIERAEVVQRVARGHAFEPARDRGQLLPEERAFGYHDAARGDYRMQVLRELIPELVRPGEAVAIAR